MIHILLDSKTKKGYGIDEALDAGEDGDHSSSSFVSPVAKSDDNTDDNTDDKAEDDDESKSDAEELF